MGIIATICGLISAGYLGLGPLDLAQLSVVLNNLMSVLPTVESMGRWSDLTPSQIERWVELLELLLQALRILAFQILSPMGEMGTQVFNLLISTVIPRVQDLLEFLKNLRP